MLSPTPNMQEVKTIMENETFSISSVAEMTGVSKNRIREWHDKGLLPQVKCIPVGSREHRRFTRDDIYLIGKIDENQKKGFVLKVAVEKAMEK
jgi:DNA-binding transcriptional MerR regulator